MVAVLERPPSSEGTTAREPLADLVVVANRLPMRRVGNEGNWQASPGGLVAALSQSLVERSVTWVGWLGETSPVSAGCEEFVADSLRMVSLPIDEGELEAFYHGFSNATLWPLYHDVIRRPTFNREWWDAYVAVNERFANVVATKAARGGAVWVHDYQLQLVPAMLRAVRPDLRIGFFLHIPFPPQELFMQLPWRRQLVAGMLGADVIGFQVPNAAQNFGVLARRLARAHGMLPTLSYEDRQVRVAAYPVSIDVGRFEELASRADVMAQAKLVREQLGSPRVLLAGVDRLDYTKGIEARLQAYRELLAEGVISAPECSMVQIAVPTRDLVPEYVEERERIERLVGEINGDFGAMGKPAVHYLHRTLDFEDLVALYLATDVMLVTPYCDGMNLVAKEYVASRLDDSGSLVLSEFAGAARELNASVLVNPHDIVGLKDGLLRAIRSHERDIRRRMRALRRAVHAWTAKDWADKFLADLKGAAE